MIVELLAGLLLMVTSLLVFPIIFESYKRRFNDKHVDAPAIFEDPNSLKQVPCPHIHDPAEKYVSLIVPAFNEEHRLPATLDETMNYLQQRVAKDKSFTYEVVIVDDGSADATKSLAFGFVKKYTVDNVRVILLGRNHGKGEAIRKLSPIPTAIEVLYLCDIIVKQGMLNARGELLLMLDADGATKVNDLEKLENQIHAVAKKEFNWGATVTDSNFRISDFPIAAFGSCAYLEEKALATRMWYCNLLMVGFHLVVLLAAGPGIRDTQASKLFTNMRLKSWSEIPGSKLNLLSIPNMIWELAIMSFGYSTGIWEICR
uniref:Glycosyltransferase 2-like domain-containing protein n=1 Tax=Manihot esculenta TaxID=3983 RepID=A0A2C9V2P1_MANES